jgi:DNA-binding transcriptional regulator YiaG
MKNEPKSQKPAQTISPDVIKLWRERMGYEPQDAIDALGVSASELLDWEQGHRPIPKHIALAMAALAMDLSPFGHQPK